MSIRKPIIKVTRKCSACKGTGSKICKEKYNYYSGKINRRKNHYVIVDCKKCNGTSWIDVKQNDSKFKKYYIKNLEEKINYLTTKYRNAKEEAYELGEELGKYCKELDKVVNK